ncbi:MAG: 4Fe-4S binding protein [Actinobacteria bacterium]|nr:4Fe-4S binding protein [Actinomycetota bacterium]
MIVREYYPGIDYSLCKLCRKCEEICPAAAISLLKEDKRMAVDVKRCIDCQRCMDACPENAITMLPRSGDYALSVDVSELDQEKIGEICRKVGLAPGEAVCACTFVTAQELAGAVLMGAKTPEDVCAMTGVRRGCGIYCLVNIFKILDAAGVRPEERAGSHLYHHPLSSLDIPDDRLREIDEEFPQYRLLEDVSMIRETRGLEDDRGA